ncbi:aldehyde dehydrogenase family protein [Dongia soli]|uniref:Aldehyde dehydrogenase family protein n=1 Tax=Dongia soli TaxID=600628 RepID=A0ABU5EEB8_9PROT|nr:aldehyde dehydrogenase family protein [Dongia soli]MDY0883803.1 aldehyde dehydrogenase family protein [Dongia soli]
MPAVQKTITPIDNSIYVERPYNSAAEIRTVLSAAQKAQAAWKHTPVAERAAILTKAVDIFLTKKDQHAEEITRQMGRPISQSPGEMRGFEERARYMIQIGPEALADIEATDKPGFTRFIRREPLGVVFIVAPWNYPYLTSVNGVIPALMAGNAVILKHSAQTPLCAESFQDAFDKAGLPKGLFQHLVLTHDDTAKVIAAPEVAYVNFTGSVAGGHAVQQAALGKFIGLGLELGGKDPAYVRADANLDHAVENLVDGAMFNSGQCCCAIERIYVHESLYDKFVDGFVDLTKKYRLGNPLDTNTNLGPMVRTSAAEFVRGQIQDAVKRGAKALVDAKSFAADKPGTPYLAPQVLVNVDHSMSVMSDESFGPVIGIMKVKSDDEAVKLMNDSKFGLTAALWTQDEQAALKIGDQVVTGTVYMNRCDYLDPALAWVGVKDSGRGATLSKVGYEMLTRPKSFHLRQI